MFLAGGHGCRADVGSGTLALAARIVSLVRNAERRANTPILAAGGIVDGRGLAAVLALGCDGMIAIVYSILLLKKTR